MDHSDIVSTLAQMEKHPGWALIRDRYADGMRKLVEQTLDQATDDQLTLKLKHAHGLMIEADPEKIRTDLITIHRKKAAEEARKALELAATDGAAPTT